MEKGMDSIQNLLDRDKLRRIYYDMSLSREFEETCSEMYARGKIYGFLHLYSGQEAVGAGAVHALHPDDYVITAYRDHGQALFKGVDARAIMAELFGKVTGICRGKGGSMHLFDLERHFMGGYAIVGGQFPIAVGLARAVKYRKRGEVVACFFGDGASNQGTFHESLNLAALWRLPIIFICENNLYGIGTYIGRAAALEDIYLRARGYGLPGRKIDGMDVLAVYRATAEAAARARDGQGPTLIEAKTYRYRTHSPADVGDYRSRREEAIWRARDPIARFRRYLLENDKASEEELAELERKAKEAVREAVRFAEESPEPDESELTRDIFCDEKWLWASLPIARH